jgi:hypothetical protein
VTRRERIELELELAAVAENSNQGEQQMNKDYRFVAEFTNLRARNRSLGAALTRQKQLTRTQNTTLDVLDRAVVAGELARQEAVQVANAAVDTTKKLAEALDSVAENLRILADRVR